MKKISLLVFSALMFTGLASADIIPSLVGSPTATAGGYLWSYQAFVTGSERLDPAASNSPTACAGTPCNPPGTFFTIYDFNGFVRIDNTPSGWSGSTQFTGVTPGGITPIPGDSAAVTNVTFTYTGPVVVGPNTTTGFNLVSTLSAQTQGAFAEQATNNTNSAFNGQTDRSTGPISVPLGVPEPSSMLLIGGGLIGLAGLRRKLAR